MRSSRFVLLTLLCSLVLAACGARPAHETGSVPAGTVLSAAAAATLANPKIAPTLAAMARKVRAAPTNTAAAVLSTSTVRVNKRREIQIYIHTALLAPDVARAIGAAGASAVRPSQALGLYQAWASPAALVRIANLSVVMKITPPVYGFPQTGGH